MKLHLRNKASHWHGNRLILLWCVCDEKGARLTGWITHTRAVERMAKARLWPAQ